MGEYHKYVFDEETRQFVGDFEEMYKAEGTDGFDSWHQDDLRDITKPFCLCLLDQYNWGKVLDIGCGKGMFTHCLKKKNNSVIGIDLSQTAIHIAKNRYPDIKFCCADISKKGWTRKVIGEDPVDLVVCLEILSYVENWQIVLKEIASIGKFAMVKLYIPEDPIGYIKSIEKLESIFDTYFQLIENVHLVKHNHYILFGQSRKYLKS